MRNAEKAFIANMSRAREQSAHFNFLKDEIKLPINLDDLLRSQIVYSVSAFDKLMHDLIRIGMVEIFTGKRPPTEKYKKESISLDVHKLLASADIPPAEFLFENEITRKLSFLSFQDPDKISDGLSLIWAEKEKWRKIGLHLGISGSDLKTRLKLIATRRNAIVHEADMHPVTHDLSAIDVPDPGLVTDFLEKCGKQIVELVCI